MTELDAMLAKARKAVESHLEQKLFNSLDEQDECIKENNRLRAQIASLKKLIEQMHDLLWDQRKAKVPR